MKQKLNGTLINSFGLGDLGFQLMVNVELMYFSKFLFAAEFSAQMVASILMITSILDVILVPTAGLIVQKSNFKWMKWGKNRSWLLIGPPIIFITFVMEFLKVGSAGLTAFIVCAGFFISHLVWNTTYTAHISLISVLTDDPFERTQLSQRRMMGQTLAKIVFGFVAWDLICTLGGGTTTPAASGYTYGAAILTFFMIVGYYVVFATTKGRDQEVITDRTQATADNEAAKEAKIPIGRLLKLTFTNSQLLLLMLADIFRCFAFYLVTSVTVYYFTCVFQDTSLMPIYLVIINVASFLGASASIFVAKRLGKIVTYIIGVIGYAIALLTVYFFVDTVLPFIIVLSLGNFLLQFSFSMITAMFSDTVTYGEWKDGESTRGFVMGLLSMPIKLSILIRSAVMGAILVAIQYVDGAAPTPAVVSGISQMFALIPAAACVVSAVILALGYKLTDKKMVEYASELQAKKAQ